MYNRTNQRDRELGRGWSTDCDITAQTIKMCWTVSREKWGTAEKAGQRDGEREREGGRAGGRGAESVLTSILEEDILSFYAAHVIFIA